MNLQQYIEHITVSDLEELLKKKGINSRLSRIRLCDTNKKNSEFDAVYSVIGIKDINSNINEENFRVYLKVSNFGIDVSL